MKFFFDNCVSRRFPEALRLFNIDAVHLLEVYKNDPGDAVWIPAICKQRLIIVTADSSQMKTKGKTAVECALYQRHRGIAFFFNRSFPEMSVWDQAAAFFRAWTNIAEAAAQAKPRDLFDVSKSGQVVKKHVRKVNS